MKKVVIDAGHGLPDPGAVNKGLSLTEESMALDVSQALSVLLKGEGYSVKNTRQDNKALSSNKSTDLAMRCNLANDWGADMFISIHFNSSGTGKASGCEVFRADTAGHDAKQLAESISSSITKAFPRMVFRRGTGTLSKSDAQTAQGKTTVLRQTKMPAVLIECGFIDNDSDALWFVSKDNITSFVKAISRGIAGYVTVKS